MTPTTSVVARGRARRRRLLLRAWAAGIAAPLMAIVVAGGSTPPHATLVLEHGPLPSVGTPPSPTRAASLTEPVPGRAVVAPSFVDGHGAGAVPAYAVASAVARHALPDDVVAAYWLAVQVAPAGCHLPVTLLMAVGQVESGNLAGRRLDASHRPVPSILGPVLDGSQGREVADTDAGQLDGNVLWDRALGPLQLVPASWRAVGVDMDGDGRRDPQDVYDAAGAAMVYFCAGDRDLSTAEGLDAAVLAFNHSRDYLSVVLRWKSAFDAAARPVDSALRTALADGGTVSGPTALAAARPSAALLGPVGVTRTTRRARPAVTSATRPATPAVTTPPTPAPAAADPAPGTGPTPPQPPPATPAPAPAPPPPAAPTPMPAPPPPAPTPTPAPAPPPAPTPTPASVPPPPAPVVLPPCPPVTPSPVVPTDPAAPSADAQPTPVTGEVPTTPTDCQPPPVP